MEINYLALPNKTESKANKEKCLSRNENEWKYYYYNKFENLHTLKKTRTVDEDKSLLKFRIRHKKDRLSKSRWRRGNIQMKILIGI